MQGFGRVAPTRSRASPKPNPKEPLGRKLPAPDLRHIPVGQSKADKILLVAKVYNKGYTFANCLDHLPEWWDFAPEEIALVGNGVVAADPSEIDSKFVIRFNEANHENAGTKTDIHFVQRVSVRRVQKDRMVYFDSAPTEANIPKVHWPIQLYSPKPTLGFRVLTMCLSSWRHATVHLYGFQGSLHSDLQSKVDLFHFIQAEHDAEDVLARVVRH